MERLAIEEQEVSRRTGHERRLQRARRTGKIPRVLEIGPRDTVLADGLFEIVALRAIDDARLQAALREYIEHGTTEEHVAIRSEHEPAARATYADVLGDELVIFEPRVE